MYLHLWNLFRVRGETVAKIKISCHFLEKMKVVTILITIFVAGLQSFFELYGGFTEVL